MTTSVTLQKVTFRVLVSDRTQYGSALWSEHGLAVHAEAIFSDGGSLQALFDTGSSPELLEHNLRETGIEPGDLHYVVLSHCHRDHTGGMVGLSREFTEDLSVVAHPEIRRKALDGRRGLRPVGPPEALWESIGEDRLIFLSEPAQIYPDIWFSGEIPRLTPFEKPREHLYTLKEGKLLPDTDPDDASMWFDLGDSGLVLLTGCSHSGLVNTVHHAARVMDARHFCAIMGGFHLVNADDETISSTAEGLEDFSINEIIPGHCTGKNAESIFGDRYGDKLVPFSTGNTFTFYRS